MKFKKMATLFLAVMLVMTAAFGLTADAAVDMLGGKGSFDYESIDAMKADGWSIVSTACTDSEDTHFKIKSGCDENGTATADSSDKALELASGANNHGLQASRKVSCAPEGTYTVSCWVKASLIDTNNSRKPRIRINKVNEDGSISGGEYISPTVNITTVGVWQKVTFEFKVDSSADAFYVTLTSNQKKEVYVDDLVISGPPAPTAEFESNTVLFYKEDGTKLESLDGVETVYAAYRPSGNVYDNDSLTLVMAVYNLVGDKKQLVSFFTDTGAPGRLYTEFDMPKEAGNYTISAFVWDGLTTLRSITDGKFDLQ